MSLSDTRFLTPHACGHIVIGKPRVCRESWWIEADRQGFTARAAHEQHVLIPVDDVSDREVRAYVQRCDVLEALIGLPQATANAAVRSVVERT